MKNLLALLLISLCCTAHAQSIERTTVIKNAVVHVGDGRVFNPGFVVFKGQFILSVGEGSDVPSATVNDTIIDAKGSHLYPAFINCNNVLGLHDAEAVRATRDFEDVGEINPHNRALIAFNTDNQIIPTVRTNGVLYTQVTPRGGLISGSSSVMSLDGWNWEDAVLKSDDGIHINMPQRPFVNVSGDEARQKAAIKEYDERMHKLDAFFVDALAYAAADKPKYDARMEAMKRNIARGGNFYFHADNAHDILAMVNLVARHHLKNVVLVGGRDAWKVTAILKQHQVPVMLGRINDLPQWSDEDVNVVNDAPAKLAKDSILFCIQLQGDMESMQSRNLSFNAGVAVAHGLSAERAVMALTGNAARILHVDKWIGTLEKGKFASMFISTGDALDMMTNQVTMAWLQGRRISLYNRQSELYLRYQKKFGLSH